MNKRLEYFTEEAIHIANKHEKWLDIISFNGKENQNYDNIILTKVTTIKKTNNIQVW